MQTPRTSAEAALAETVDAVMELRGALEQLPQRIQTSLEPSIRRFEEAARNPRPSTGAQATTQAGPVDALESPASEPRRYATPGELKTRYCMRHLLLAGAIGLVGGLLIASIAEVRIPGIAW